MSIECCVPDCTSTDATKSLFGFPRQNLNLLDSWINEIPNLDINHLDLDFSCICEDHFRPEEVITSSHNLKELRAGAVPSIFHCLQINLNACRFCLKIKNLDDQLVIDEEIRKHFESLMGLEVTCMLLFGKFKIFFFYFNFSLTTQSNFQPKPVQIATKISKVRSCSNRESIRPRNFC